MKHLIFSLFSLFILFSCDKDQGTKNTMPTKLSVNIPDNLSGNASSSRGDTLNGKDTYELLRAFVKVGEDAAEVVDGIAASLHEHNIDQAMEFSFTGDDGRKKSVSVEEKMSYDGATWDLKLTLTDKELSDTALQVFWNKNAKEGIAILQPYHMNREDNNEQPNAMYKIDYSEEDVDYEARMIVEVVAEATTDEWGIDRLKIFVGKNGEEFELYGNSNHPNVDDLFASYTGGANYVFTAKSNEDKDIAVAQIALPPSTLNTIDDVFDTYSVKNVIIEQVIINKGLDTADYTPSEWDAIEQQIASQLINIEAPAYFNSNGFIIAGSTLPSGFTNNFIDMSGLTPYIPNTIKNLAIKFE